MNSGGDSNSNLVGEVQVGRSSCEEPAPLRDEVLLSCLRDGNHNALTVLFDRYHRLVLSIALRILRDAGEAEDITQSVFLEIFRSADQFDSDRGTVKIWILQ